MKIHRQFLLKLLGTVSSFALIFSSIAMYIHPVIFPWSGFLSLLFVPLLVINAFFFVFFLLRIGKVSATISAFALVLGLSLLPRLWQISFRNVKAKSENISVMSYNVRLFDLYNWRGNKATKDSIFAYLKTASPDIICFQEFYWDETNDFNTKDSLHALLSLPYITERYSSKVLDVYHFGIASFSKYPIIHEGAIRLEDSPNLAIYSDIVVPWDTIRVYNIHLESLRFMQEDYDILTATNGLVYSIKNISTVYAKLKRAFVLRATQARQVIESIKHSPHPVVLMGDFNDSPLSYVYETIYSELDLKDAFRESGDGFGGTYNGRLPSYRIDYILHTPDIESIEFNVSDVSFSDHFPITCRIQPSE